MNLHEGIEAALQHVQGWQDGGGAQDLPANGERGAG